MTKPPEMTENLKNQVSEKIAGGAGLTPAPPGLESGASTQPYWLTSLNSPHPMLPRGGSIFPLRALRRLHTLPTHRMAGDTAEKRRIGGPWSPLKNIDLSAFLRAEKTAVESALNIHLH